MKVKVNIGLEQFSVVGDIGISSGGCGISRFPVLCGSGVLFFFLTLLLYPAYTWDKVSGRGFGRIFDESF